MITLWPHQAEYGDKLLRQEIRALWWEMRTGKTLTALHGARDGDILVVCPNSVKGVWEHDALLYGYESVYIWNKKKKRPDSRPRVCIVNYESLWRSPLLSWEWDTVIFDESHRLANFRTKLFEHVYKHLFDLWQGRIILLSGTPCPEGYHQVIAPTIIATGSFDGKTDPWEAIREDWTYDDDQYKWLPNKGTNSKAKWALHAYGHTMTQEEAGIHTRKLYRVIPVELSTAEERAWKDLLASDPEITGARFGQLAQSYASGRNADGVTVRSSKLDTVAEYCAELGRPAVVLAHYTSSLEYLRDKLAALGKKVALIDGNDRGSEYRSEMVNQFNNSELDVLVCQISTVKVGLNFSHSDTLIFAENNFSGEARIQAEERCTVKGKEAVEIIDFVASSGIEGLCDIDLAIRSAVIDKKDFNASALRRRDHGSRSKKVIGPVS